MSEPQGYLWTVLLTDHGEVVISHRGARPLILTPLQAQNLANCLNSTLETLHSRSAIQQDRPVPDAEKSVKL